VATTGAVEGVGGASICWLAEVGEKLGEGKVEDK